uniref:DNA polymerase delta interacting protein 3 n=1 Tax=Hippocampus comes TaxID=109280 RepID=A0A3Q3D6U8_HIPCM
MRSLMQSGKMADVSLDEVIRQRGINVKMPVKRTMFGRGAGGVGRTFDARQRIGITDARQRLGGGAGFPLKDAREKLIQKDARFKIRGRGGAASGGGVQDARQMINSRKQQQNVFTVPIQTIQKTAVTHQLQSHSLVPQIKIQANNNFAGANARLFAQNVQGLSGRDGTISHLNKGMTDARDRLSLKRSMSSGLQSQVSTLLPLKITKTIQQRPVGVLGGMRLHSQPVSNDHDCPPSKQIKITTSNNLLQSRDGPVGSPFSMSAPITKVVKNDAYSAPRPPVPVAPARPTTSTAAPRPPAAALKSVSRTLQHSSAQHSPAPPPPKPVTSPLEGTKITVNNLHPRVTEEDIVELFCVCGALKRARLVKVGVAEVVFVRKEDAVSAYRKYNNRCLDGQPMKCNIHIQGNVITSDQPILLRLSDTPNAGSVAKKDGLPPSLSRSGSQRTSQPTPEVDPQTILKALFKSTAQSSSTTEPPSSQATAFRIKI